MAEGAQFSKSTSLFMLLSNDGNSLQRAGNGTNICEEKLCVEMQYGVLGMLCNLNKVQGKKKQH